MMSIRPKSKKIGKTIKKIKGKGGIWEVYSYNVKSKKFFANRLVAKNGWIVCTNNGFTTLKNAELNIEKVQKLA